MATMRTIRARGEPVLKRMLIADGMEALGADALAKKFTEEGHAGLDSEETRLVDAAFTRDLLGYARREVGKRAGRGR